jgi:putative transposase
METQYPSDLTDAQWTCLHRHLPLATAQRQRRHSLRRVFDVIFYLLRNGLWPGVLAALRRAERMRVGRDPQPSAAIIDAQSVKTVEESASISGYDGHKRVKGRKRHMLVDTLGLPVSISVTSAGVHGKVGAWRLLAGLKPLVPRLAKIWADGAYTSQKLARWCAGYAGVRRPAAVVGGRTKFRLAGAQSSAAHRLRREGADERDAHRGGVHSPAPATAREERMKN